MLSHSDSLEKETLAAFTTERSEPMWSISVTSMLNILHITIHIIHVNASVAFASKLSVNPRLNFFPRQN